VPQETGRLTGRKEVTVGVLSRFERRVERLVSGAFAKAFKAEVQPVEIASALQKACDERAAIVSRGRTMVPNSFVVELGRYDFERLTPYATALGDELAGIVRDHAQDQHYTFIGPVTVRFTEVDDLETGLFRTTASAVAGVTPTGRANSTAKPTQSPTPYAAPASPKAPEPASQAKPADSYGSASPPQQGAPAGLGDATQAMAAVGAQRSLGWLQVGDTKLAITAAVTVIGRGTDVDLRIDDPGVSRRHAEVRLHGDEAMIVDLGSTNGVLLDGRVVTDAVLTDGASVRLGSTDIVFHREQG
jgi:hypothetical protein